MDTSEPRDHQRTTEETLVSHDYVRDVQPAVQLHPNLIRDGISCAANLAIDLGVTTVFLGVLGDGFATCDQAACCGNRPGAFVVVPDVELLEIEANDGVLPSLTTHLRRPDGRTVRVFPVPAAASQERAQ